MHEVFEKIIEKLEERTSFLSDCTKYGNKDAEQQNKSYSTMMMYEVSDLVDDLIEIVKQAAAEYNKDKYFNLDHATLHKCPKCGTYAEHRVNRKGLWACGCFECNLFKTAYDHGKAIEDWENFCAKYNNGWIPCEKEMPPIPEENPMFENKPLELYLVSVEDEKYSFRAFWNGKIFTDGFSNVEATAWQPLPESYQPKGE